MSTPFQTIGSGPNRRSLPFRAYLLVLDRFFSLENPFPAPMANFGGEPEQ